MENTPNQYMDIITEMIQTSRREFNDDSNIYLLWGWAISIASLTQFILIQLHHEDISAISWAILVPLALISQIVMMAKMKKKEKVKTHIDSIMGYLWTAFGISLAIVLFSQGKLHEAAFPMILVLYAIGTFVSGGAMKFKPLIIGGTCCWVLAVACFFVPMQFQLLLLALAVIVSYLIPGYLLKLRHRKNV